MPKRQCIANWEKRMDTRTGVFIWFEIPCSQTKRNECLRRRIPISMDKIHKRSFHLHLYVELFGIRGENLSDKSGNYQRGRERGSGGKREGTDVINGDGRRLVLG